MSRIKLIVLGGTITSKASSSARPERAGVRPSMGGRDLLAAAPEIAAGSDIEVLDIASDASYEFNAADMVAVAVQVDAAFRDDFAGVVVVQGTDSLEETAYALALTLKRGRPIVLTGAMRSPAHLGADGPGNLSAAIQVAASSDAYGVGPLVVVNDEIHAARWVQKTHTTKPSAFSSPGTGPIGEVAEGRTVVWFQPRYEDFLGMPDLKALSEIRVELVRAFSGMDGALLRTLTQAGGAGVVIEGTGGGHLPSGMLGALDELVASGSSAVVASRCASGSTLERMYAMAGGEIDLQERGAVMAGTISGPKARLRLLIGTAIGLEARQVFPVR